MNRSWATKGYHNINNGSTCLCQTKVTACSLWPWSENGIKSDSGDRGAKWVDSTYLQCALCIAASSFNSISEIRRKEVVYKSSGPTNKLVGMLNKGYLHCLGALFKGNVKSVVTTYADHKQCFYQLKQDWANGSQHASSLDYNRGGAGMYQEVGCHKSSYNNTWLKSKSDKRKDS